MPKDPSETCSAYGTALQPVVDLNARQHQLLREQKLKVEDS